MTITCDDTVNIQNGEHVDNMLITSSTGVTLFVFEDNKGNINIKFENNYD